MSNLHTKVRERELVNIDKKGRAMGMLNASPARKKRRHACDGGNGRGDTRDHDLYRKSTSVKLPAVRHVVGSKK